MNKEEKILEAIKTTLVVSNPIGYKYLEEKLYEILKEERPKNPPDFELKLVSKEEIDKLRIKAYEGHNTEIKDTTMTHHYINSKGNYIKCFIVKKAKNEEDGVIVQNEHKARVCLKMKDLIKL